MWIIHNTLPEDEEYKMKMEKKNSNENGNALININIQKWKIERENEKYWPTQTRTIDTEKQSQKNRIAQKLTPYLNFLNWPLSKLAEMDKSNKQFWTIHYQKLFTKATYPCITFQAAFIKAASFT